MNNIIKCERCGDIHPSDEDCMVGEGKWGHDEF